MVDISLHDCIYLDWSNEASEDEAIQTAAPTDAAAAGAVDALSSFVNATLPSFFLTTTTDLPALHHRQ